MLSGDVAPGTQLLVKRNTRDAKVLVHFVVGHYAHSEFYVLTPDGELQFEDYADQDKFLWVRVRPEAGPLPGGVTARNLEEFDELPSQMESPAAVGAAGKLTKT